MCRPTLCPCSRPGLQCPFLGPPSRLPGLPPRRPRPRTPLPSLGCSLSPPGPHGFASFASRTSSMVGRPRGSPLFFRLPVLRGCVCFLPSRVLGARTGVFTLFTAGQDLGAGLARPSTMTMVRLFVVGNAPLLGSWAGIEGWCQEPRSFVAVPSVGSCCCCLGRCRRLALFLTRPRGVGSVCGFALIG